MRAVVVAAVLALLATLAFVWVDREPDHAKGPADAEPAAQPAAAAARAGVGGDRSRPTMPAATPHTAAAPATPAELQARDQRRRQALGPFAASLLPSFDGCLQAGAGPRTPQRLVVHFERSAATDPAVEQFAVSAIEPADVAPGGPAPQQTPAWACIQAVIGRKLTIAAGAVSQESRFREVVAIPLPATVGWARPIAALPSAH